MSRRTHATAEQADNEIMQAEAGRMFAEIGRNEDAAKSSRPPF